MFAILVTSLFEDCQDNILLNYLTNKIFYNNGFTFDFISGIITQAGVTNATIINNMWFDDNYGFINPSGFLTWVKIVMRKNISTGIGKYLIGYFNITDQIMQNLVINANAWLVLQVSNETSTLSVTQTSFHRSTKPSASSPRAKCARPATTAQCNGALKT